MSLLLGLTSSQLRHVVPDIELPTSTYVDLLESIGCAPPGAPHPTTTAGITAGASSRVKPTCAGWSRRRLSQDGDRATWPS